MTVRVRRALLVLAALGFAALLAVRPVRAHLRAAGLLLRFADANATGAVADYQRYPVDEAPATVGDARARIYTPRGAAADAPGVVLVHGVHRLAIDEPRLQSFARAVASTGVVVLTPEIREIADYTVAPASIETIGEAARSLRARLGGAKVGLMGMSFAGGLSLLAAADPRYADDVAFVVAVGAHHDLGRVARFFATSVVERPDGSTTPLAAHDYGMLVLIYSHVEDFVPAIDAAGAREALRLWLWERPAEARARALALGPDARRLVEALFDKQTDRVLPAYREELMRRSEALARVSPHGHLEGLHAPVFLLHGAGDSVIPSAETLWIASELPPDLLRAALVSDAIVHVEMTGDAGAGDQWALVHFMAGVLDEADASQS